MYFHFRSRRVSFISKVTRVHKAATAANDTSLCSTNLVVFLGFYPARPGWNFPDKQTTKFVPVTKPGLPGSYEEVLNWEQKEWFLIDIPLELSLQVLFQWPPDYSDHGSRALWCFLSIPYSLPDSICNSRSDMFRGSFICLRHDAKGTHLQQDQSQKLASMYKGV